MRFSTIAAFILPLSALAAPVSERDHKDSESVSDNAAKLEQLRVETATNIATLNTSLIAILENGRRIQEGSHQDVVYQIVDIADQVLNDKFKLLVKSGVKIATKIRAGQPPDQNDQAVFADQSFKIQDDFTRLQKHIDSSIAAKEIPQHTIDDINKTIVPKLVDAKGAIDAIIVAGCAVLAIGGPDPISLNDLFNKFGIDIAGRVCPPLSVY